MTLWMLNKNRAPIVILIIRTSQQLQRESSIDAYGGGSSSNDVIRRRLPTRILGRICPPRGVSFVWIPTTKAMSSYGPTILTTVPTVSTLSVPWIILCIFGRMTPIPVPSVDKRFYGCRQHKVWKLLLRLLSQKSSSYHKGTDDEVPGSLAPPDSVSGGIESMSP
jgi:hypothetical protein